MRKLTALVTGSSQGIGAGIVLSLRADGWNLLTPTRDELNLSEPASIECFLSSLDVPVDGLVLNAGINVPGLIGKMSVGTYEKIQLVNVTSGFELLSGLVPPMAERDFGRVVAISSAYSLRARGGRVAYSASKAALEAVVRTVSIEFADRGVVANCVAPGFVDTELTRKNNTPAMIDGILHRVPVGRLASAEEIGRAVTFLMSPDNEYITGQTLNVDGGFSCM